MKYCICDKCKKSFKEKDFYRLTPVTISRSEKVELCDECIDKLNELITKVKYDFISKE